MAEETVMINKLPVRTWSWLGVNGVKTVSAPADSPAPEQSPDFTVPAGETKTVCLRMSAEKDTAAVLTLQIGAGAKLRLIQVLAPSAGSVLQNRVTGVCAAGGRVELVQVLAGEGDIYDDIRIDLEGSGSSLKADIGYLAGGHQTFDMNLVANHIGRQTKSEISANGALRDAARKIFRGTIDFRTGSAGSEGDEQETVLLLGDRVENKTVPLILCSEETVAGNHGATVGELDEGTLFYFESRGISREAAEEIMARAAVLHTAAMIDDAETAAFARTAAGCAREEE